MHSVTKSVGSTLIGIAHRQGKIRLDQHLNEFFSDYYPIGDGLYAGKEQISVEHVLQQRHGIEWDEWTLPFTDPQNPVYQAITSGDWYRYILTRPMDAQPGEKFTYSTIGSSLMSRMIRKVSGESPRVFATKQLFEPLGITNIHWELFSQEGMGQGETDFPNPDNDEPLGFALWLRPQDMLTYGELYLNGGVHEGRRIIDQSWIDASWTNFSNEENTPLFTERGADSGYGYQWWSFTIIDDLGREWPLRYAAGWARQRIIIIPWLNMVIVSVADDYDFTGPSIGTLLQTIILPELNLTLDRRFNGAWYNPLTDGQGLTLEVVNNGQTLIGFWYTYTDDGQLRWFTMDGPIDKSEANVTIIETSGGLFLQDDPVTRTVWGSGHFTVIDCNNVSFEINSEETNTSVPLSRLTGTCEAQ
jgi:CubicO group peptidase (beta-lactamase class C family)